ncbi:hypothetical protein ACFU8W_43030 [Streptomyces sp. NPDC057565]
MPDLVKGPDGWIAYRTPGRDDRYPVADPAFVADLAVQQGKP